MTGVDARRARPRGGGLRIAQVAPLYERVPPETYGGTERVVAHLTDGLVRRGHDVTLYATADSRTAARLVPVTPRALRLHPPADPVALHLLELVQAFEHVPVFDYLAFALARLARATSVHTLHGRLTTALFDTVLQLEGLRMPELFCGFAREPGYGPTRYPVACSPQAWSAAVVFQLVAGMLGLIPDAANHRLVIDRPVLPPWLEALKVFGLRVGDTRFDLLLERGRHGAMVELLDRRGPAELLVRR